MGYTGHFPGVVFPLLYHRCREILLGEGCPIQHSFATQQCPGPPPIHAQLSSQHRSSASTTEHFPAYSTSGPRSYSDSQEILFTLQVLLGGKGKWWIMNNLVTILEGLLHLQSHKTYWFCLAFGFGCHQEWDLEPLLALCSWFLWIWEVRWVVQRGLQQLNEAQWEAGARSASGWLHGNPCSAPQGAY